VTPMTVAISRHNNPDALLVLCCVAALWCEARGGALADGGLGSTAYTRGRRSGRYVQYICGSSQLFGDKRVPIGDGAWIELGRSA
jgi:hypothetical protein